MKRRIAPRLLVGMLVPSLITVGAQPALATIVFDDHFTGNSGGVPVSWIGEGTVVEGGTTVTLYGTAGIGTIPTFDPSAATMAIVIAIASTDHKAQANVLDSGDWANHFFVKFKVGTGEIDVRASDTTTGEEQYIAGYVAGYAGGAIGLTLVLEPDTFSISTDTPTFSTGPIAYSAVFTTFTRSDLGTATIIALENDLAGLPSGYSSYDRVTVNIGPPVPVESWSFGQIKAVYWH